MLQGWMEYAISSLRDPNNSLDFEDISQSLNRVEGILLDRFEEDLRFYNRDYGIISDGGYFITFEDRDILRHISDDEGNNDGMGEIRLSIILSNRENLMQNGKGLPITLYTRIYLNPNSY